MPQIYTTKSTRQRKNKDGTNAPQPKCEVCHRTIEVGMPHRNVSPRIGVPVRVRCVDCPSWQPWDLSDALWARVAQIQYDFTSLVDDFEEKADAEAALEELVSAINELAEEKRESAQNIEDGFQHATQQSDELNEQADALESWASELEGISIPETPEPEEEDCEECDADGRVDGEECKTCEGDGQVTPNEPTDDQLGAWRDEVRDACDAVDQSPV